MSEECRWTVNQVIDGSSKMTELFPEHGPAIEARTGPGPINTVKDAPARLQETARQQSDSQGDKEASNEAYRHLCREAASFLGKRKKAISKAFPKQKSVQKEFGVGTTLSVRNTKTITSGLERFITAGRADPARLQAASVTTDELTTMEGYRAKIEASQRAGGAAKTKAMNSTTIRNAVQLEAENAMIKVVTAATLVFENRPEIVALFEATLPKTRSGSRKSNKASPQTPAPQTVPV